MLLQPAIAEDNGTIYYLNRNVVHLCYLPKYERGDCIGCITLVCIVFYDEPSMQLGLMILFMFILRINHQRR